MRTNMNKCFFICLFMLAPLLMGSCDFWGESNNTESKEIKTIEVFPDSVRKHIIEQDSLSRELISKIDTLTMELNASKNDVDQLRTDIKGLNAPGKVLVVLSLLSMLISIIAIVLVIIRTNKIVEKWEIREIAKLLIREKNKDLEFRINRAETNIKEIGKESSVSKSTPTNSSFDKRLLELEIKVNKIAGGTSMLTHSELPNPRPSMDSKVDQEQENVKTGYAKVNSNKYFVEIFSSKQEECIYTIKFTSKEEGEFDILSLEKIKSINGLKDVVDLTPDSCLLEEATNYKVVEKGRCKKTEGVWEVTKKLVIRVSK